jgi:F-type H+-transporting ATPase subunit epsilon
MASDRLLDIDIVTPQRIIYSGKCAAVSLPGTKAPFQVLHNHAPIVSALELGAIKIINTDDSVTFYATEGGFAEVQNNKVSVVVETAETSAEIDAKAVSASIESLKEKLNASTILHEREELKLAIAKQENRLRVAMKQG